VATDLTLLGIPDVVVTPSAAARTALVGMGLNEVAIRVIPYGIESTPPSQAVDDADRAAITSLPGPLVVLCLGTIGERKNQALLVAALARCPQVSAVFIGDGDVEGLRQAAEEAGVASRVRVLGYRPDASRYLAHADVLVLPSRNEGLPIAVLEAMRAGVTVVGSDIPELAEAVDDGVTGALFTAGDANELAATLERVTSPLVRSRLGAAARRVFLERFSADRMIDAYKGLYGRVIAGRLAA
jgi:glycosyltransferase involved in cell wall biosynthesis